jgi:formamidopyrimidine-DNA glycosylase
MIELPEAYVIANQIDSTLTGRTIVDAVANASPHKFAWYFPGPAEYNHLLAGKIINGASATGNHMEVLAGERTLVISTPVKYHVREEAAPKKHQLLLALDDGASITCTVQMWGVLMCLPESLEGALPDYQISKQKPSPLSEAFDRAYFKGLLAEAGGSISAKEFLATKQRIPGLGNGVLQDILWTAGIHPRRKMGELTGAETGAMYEAVKGILAEMTAKGGRDTERDLFDCPGGYKTILSKNTVDGPCPACGTTIRKEAFMGGAIYFCPVCQR